MSSDATEPGSLAKAHPDYPKFDELRSERGSLANIIMEAQTLHRPFLKDVAKDLGYGFTTIQKQAIEFQSKQLMKTLKQEKLDHAISQKLNVLAAYVDARDQFAQTWKELKPQLKDAEGTLLKPTLDAQMQSLRQLSNERDKLAYKIVDRFEDYHSLAQSLQITLDTSKIFHQSENGHRQTCIEQYLKGETQLGKGMAAFELNQLWQAEKEIGSKATVRELLENKINLLEVRSEAQAFERIQLQGTLNTNQDKQLFKDLSHYQNIKDTARDHYKLCLEEANEKGIKSWETSYYPSYAEVNKEKNASAYTLIKQPYSSVESMANKMSVSLRGLDQEAHRHDLRQTSDVYLSGMGAHSVLAAKELRAWLDFDRETGSKQAVGMLAESKILPKELIAHIQEKEASFKQTQLQRIKAEISSTLSPESQTPKGFQSFRSNESQNLHESLKERVGGLSQTLLGDPSSRSAYQYRFGRKGSISVMVSGSNQGLYSNFETGVHGSPIKMIEEKLQLSPREAIGWAKDWLGQTLTPVVTPSISQKQSIIKHQDKGATWTPILPVPSHAPKLDIKNNSYLSYMTKEREVTSIYAYKDQQGQTLGYVARLEDKDGSKITPTLTYCENEKGQQHWRWKGFGDNRPLYGLDRLTENKPVLIVEGEKTADAAQKLLPNHAVLSWPGGVGAVNKADWSPLIGRDVTIWPDHDVPGFIAAEKIENTLKQLHQDRDAKCVVKTVDLPNDLPLKWDLADKMPKNLSIEKVRTLISGNEPSVSQKDEANISLSVNQENKTADPVIKTIKGIIEKNPQYDAAEDIVNRVHQVYRGIKEIISTGKPLADKEDLHLLKQCVYATGEALNIREMNTRMSSNPLTDRVEAEKSAWMQAVQIEKTDSLRIQLPYQRIESATAFRENWDKAATRAAVNISLPNPTMDPAFTSVLGQEAIRLVNILPHHHAQVKEFIHHKASYIDSHHQGLVKEAATLAVIKGGKNDLNNETIMKAAKTLLVKEIIEDSIKAYEPNHLSEKITLETQKEQQRLQFIEQRYIQQQQQLQRDNQRSL